MCSPETPCLGLDLSEADWTTVPSSEARPLSPRSCKISFWLTLRTSGVGWFSHQASSVNTSTNQSLLCRTMARWGFMVTTSTPRTGPPAMWIRVWTPSLPRRSSPYGVLSGHMEKDTDPAFFTPCWFYRALSVGRSLSLGGSLLVRCACQASRCQALWWMCPV